MKQILIPKSRNTFELDNKYLFLLNWCNRSVLVQLWLWKDLGDGAPTTTRGNHGHSTGGQRWRPEGEQNWQSIFLCTFKRSWYLGAASSAALAEPSLCWECRPPHLASPHSGGDWSHRRLHDRHQHDHLQHRLKGDLDDLLCHLARVWLHLLLRRGKKLVSSSPNLSFLQCVTGVYDFPSALLFSVETMTTIGY